MINSSGAREENFEVELHVKKSQYDQWSGAREENFEVKLGVKKSQYDQFKWSQ